MAVVLLVVLAACSGPVTSRDAPQAEDYEPVSHFLTTGDPIAGRQSFIDLECFTCHAVSGEPFATEPNQNGPRLGAMEAHKSHDAIAAAIVHPSHTISKRPGKWHERPETGMTEYGRVMTVRQLIDIVAYVRSLP